MYIIYFCIQEYLYTKGVIYRDFKLENFFLDDFGNLLIYLGYLVFYYFILML